MPLQLKVPSMVCEGCAETVTKAIKDLDANATVNVDLATKDVSAETSASESDVREAITNTGHTIA